MTEMTIWDFNKMLTRRLLAWAAVSVLAGLGWLQREDDYWRGVGMQFAAWGAVDAVIALIGRRQTQRREKNPAEAADTAVQAQEAANLRRLLGINTGLDVLYVLGGAWLARTRGAEDTQWRGHGHGIIVQGAFLFLFDLWHLWRLGKIKAPDRA